MAACRPPFLAGTEKRPGEAGQVVAGGRSSTCSVASNPVNNMIYIDIHQISSGGRCRLPQTMQGVEGNRLPWPEKEGCCRGCLVFWTAMAKTARDRWPERIAP